MLFVDQDDDDETTEDQIGVGRSLYGRIAHAWRRANDGDKVDVFRTPPPAELAEALIDAAFYASFITEEGRQQRFRVALFQRGDARRWQLETGAPRVSFPEPRTLTARNLAKCAAIHDPANSIIVVSGEEELLIRELAVAPHIEQVTGLEPVALPDALTLSVLKPGSMTVSRGNIILGRFAAGEFVEARSRTLHSRSLGRGLVHHVQRHSGYEEVGIDYWYMYRRALRYLLAKVAGAGRGALIIWSPSSIRLEVEEQIEHKHRLSARHEIPNQILTCAKADNRKIRRYANLEERRQLITKIDCLAALCGIDGALWIDDNMRARSAGAIIRAPKWGGPVRAGRIVGGRPDRIDLALFGTRHRAAIDLAGSCPEAVAFIISGDGVVRAATKVGEEVHLWMDVLASNSFDT